MRRMPMPRASDAAEPKVAPGLWLPESGVLAQPDYEQGEAEQGEAELQRMFDRCVERRGTGVGARC